MRCTRCGGWAVPQTLGRDPHAGLIFGWCRECLTHLAIPHTQAEPVRGRGRSHARLFRRLVCTQTVSGFVQADPSASTDPTLDVSPSSVRATQPSDQQLDQRRWLPAALGISIAFFGLLMIAVAIVTGSDSTALDDLESENDPMFDAAVAPQVNEPPRGLFGVGGAAAGLFGLSFWVLSQRPSDRYRMALRAVQAASVVGLMTVVLLDLRAEFAPRPVVLTLGLLSVMALVISMWLDRHHVADTPVATPNIDHAPMTPSEPGADGASTRIPW